jgi:hypothetical protein
MSAIQQLKSFKMIETIKHLFGLCGEPHANIFLLLFGLIPSGYYIKNIFRIKIKKLKNEKTN